MLRFKFFIKIEQNRTRFEIRVRILKENMSKSNKKSSHININFERYKYNIYKHTEKKKQYNNV